MANQYGKAGGNEAEIRKLIDDWATAFRARDIDRIMACYAPEIVAFDMPPPLEYKGADAYRKSWEDWLPMTPDPLGIDMRDLTIVAGEDTAFCHCLNHFTGKKESGEDVDTWMRATVCYRKIDGKWLVVHEHISVPIEMESGKALFDLKP